MQYSCGRVVRVFCKEMMFCANCVNRTREPGPEVQHEREIEWCWLKWLNCSRNWNARAHSHSHSHSAERTQACVKEWITCSLETKRETHETLTRRQQQTQQRRLRWMDGRDMGCDTKSGMCAKGVCANCPSEWVSACDANITSCDNCVRHCRCLAVWGKCFDTAKQQKRIVKVIQWIGRQASTVSHRNHQDGTKRAVKWTQLLLSSGLDDALTGEVS